MSHELDPLLANLSPTSTLEALEATEAIDPEGRAGQSVLHDSVAAASTSERALGIRAALAGKKLKEWHAELTAWPWPNMSSSSRNLFRMPSKEDRSIERSVHNHEAYINKAISEEGSAYDSESPEDEEYWGGLPAKVVEVYEDRIEEIVEDMEALGVEELKDYVRDAHLISNPRRVSRTMQDKGLSGTQYIHLDDFTAVITATIMQALPIISRLNSLVGTWSMRLVILRQIPVFLELLEHSQFSIAAAWHAIGNIDEMIATGGLEATSMDLSSKRATLENIICELGRRLDSMLDLLEGREDTIPEEWIDSMESIEAEFGNWVVETERRLMEEEWKLDRRDSGTLSHEEEGEPILHDHEKLPETNADNKIIGGLPNSDGYNSENRANQTSHHHEELSNTDTKNKIPETGYGSGSHNIEDRAKHNYQDLELLLDDDPHKEKPERGNNSDRHTSSGNEEQTYDEFERLSNADRDIKITECDSIDSDTINDKAEQTYQAHEDPPDTNTNGKLPEWGSTPFSIDHPKSIPLSLAAPFGSHGQTDDIEAHEMATTKSDVEPNNIDIVTEPDNSRFSKLQDESSLLGETVSHTLEATSNLSDSKASSRETTEQDREHKKAYSLDGDDEAADGLDPANKSPPSIIVSVRGGYFGLNHVSNSSKTVITDEGGTHFHTQPISTVSILPNIQPNTFSADLALNESAGLVEAASVSSATSGKLSTPADNWSVDISEIQVPIGSKGKIGKTPKPAPLLLRQLHSNSESNGPSELSSDSSIPGSGTSEYFSNKSSPEIQHASMAEYFENPVEVSTPLKGPSTPLGFSRRPSMLPERGDNGIWETGSIPAVTLSLNNRRRASSFAPSLPDSAGFVDELPVHRETVRSHIRVRSASLKSFEVIPRHEVRSIAS